MNEQRNEYLTTPTSKLKQTALKPMLDCEFVLKAM